MPPPATLFQSVSRFSLRDSKQVNVGFEVERMRLMRTKMLIYCAIDIVLGIGGFVLMSLTNLMSFKANTSSGLKFSGVSFALNLITILFPIAIGLVLWCVAVLRPRMAMLFSVLLVPVYAVGSCAYMLCPIEENAQINILAGYHVCSILCFMVLQFAAAYLLPWSIKEAMASGASFLIIRWLPVLAMGEFPSLFAILSGCLLLTVFIILPSVGITWKRYKVLRIRHEHRLMESQLTEVSAEVAGARTLHESFFPKDRTEGPWRSDSLYVPARDLGGDLLFIREIEGAQSCVGAVIDVTGHGFSAALVASHLQAVIRRHLHADPSASPEAILSDLNEYIASIFQDHGSFASAFCFRLMPRQQRLMWASAGHPPAFLFRQGAAAPELLESGACILGVLGQNEFVLPGNETQFKPGDRLFLYTDGSFEASRHVDGKQIGLQAFGKLVADEAQGEPQHACHRIMNRLRMECKTPFDDDTLMILVWAPPSDASCV